jgi:hypothetical protein
LPLPIFYSVLKNHTEVSAFLNFGWTEIDSSILYENNFLIQNGILCFGTEGF